MYPCVWCDGNMTARLFDKVKDWDKEKIISIPNCGLEFFCTCGNNTTSYLLSPQVYSLVRAFGVCCLSVYSTISEVSLSVQGSQIGLQTHKHK